MKIFLTGATGLIGAHTAVALLKSGHSLRLLVRNKALAQQYFSDHGYELNDFVVADMRDKKTIKETMQGCDAVFHAAAMVSLDLRKAQEIYQSNIEGIDAVIGSAHELGIKNIVYVSSLGVFFIPDGGPVTEVSPLGTSKDAYTRSKIDCETHVRKLQEQGAPVQITYPGGTLSPNDPKLNESNHALTAILKIIPKTSTGMQCVDARDMANIHVKLLENIPESDTEGRYTSARYIVAGIYYPWSDMRAMLEKLTGRKIFAPPIPGPLLRFFGLIGDGIKKIYPMDFPLSSDSMRLASQWSVADSSKVLNKFDLSFRHGEETFGDTIKWMTKKNYVSKKTAGYLSKD